MRSGTVHTVSVEAYLAPFEPRESCIALCMVKLESQKRCFPWFFPIRKSVAIGKAKILLTHNTMMFPISVRLPKVREDTIFEVFVSLFGREYVASEPILITEVKV